MMVNAEHAELIDQSNRENAGNYSLPKVKDRMRPDAGLTSFAAKDLANSLQIHKRVCGGQRALEESFYIVVLLPGSAAFFHNLESEQKIEEIFIYLFIQDDFLGAAKAKEFSSMGLV